MVIVHADAYIHDTGLMVDGFAENDGVEDFAGEDFLIGDIQKCCEQMSQAAVAALHKSAEHVVVCKRVVERTTHVLPKRGFIIMLCDI